MSSQREDGTAPLFQSVFGQDWHSLPPVIKRHYANRPHQNDINVATGVMKIEISPLGKLMAPFFALAGTLVPFEGDNIPAVVEFRSDLKSNNLYFDRHFHFTHHKPYRFLSCMKPLGGNEVVEYMRSGMGWHMKYAWDGFKVTLTHKRYVFKIFGIVLPLPVEFLLGKGYAEETPIDDHNFSMMMEIRHPLWGQIYGYSGVFRMADIS